MARDKPDRVHSIPAREIKVKNRGTFIRKVCSWGDLPYTEELNIDIDRKCLLECVRLLPPNVIRFCVHLVCEWNLLVVARRQKTDFVDHPSQAVGKDQGDYLEQSWPEEALPASSVGTP